MIIPVNFYFTFLIFQIPSKMNTFRITFFGAFALSVAIHGNVAAGQCFKSEEAVTEQPSSSESNSNYQAAFYERQLDFSLDMFHKLYNKVFLKVFHDKQIKLIYHRKNMLLYNFIFYSRKTKRISFSHHTAFIKL